MRSIIYGGVLQINRVSFVNNKFSRLFRDIKIFIPSVETAVSKWKEFKIDQTDC